MTKTRRTVPHRRKREGKTDYKRRLQLLKGKRDRVIVRKTNTQIIIQIVRYEADGDKVLLTVTSTQLKQHGWKHNTKNIPAAYLTGLLASHKAKEKKVKEAIVDLGLQNPRRGSKLYAAVKGFKEGGIDVPVNEEAYPSEERIKGEHVASYLDKHKAITKDFDSLKEKFMKKKDK